MKKEKEIKNKKRKRIKDVLKKFCCTVAVKFQNIAKHLGESPENSYGNNLGTWMYQFDRKRKKVSIILSFTTKI